MAGASQVNVVRHRASRGRRGVLALAMLALAGAVGASVVLGGGDGRDAGASGGASDGEGRVATAGPTTTAAPELTAQRVFAVASRRLQIAGSFAYRGTVQAGAPSVARPGPWLDGELGVEGEVGLPDRLHEVAIDPSGRAAETLVAGMSVWGRTAASRDGLASGDYATVASLPGGVRRPSGAALVPTWLGATIDRTDAGTDPQGRRMFRATVPADHVADDTPGRTSTDAAITLVVDDVGQPVHVEVTAGAGGPWLHVALDIERIGASVAVAPPGADPTARPGTVGRRQAVDAGIAAPVALTRVPAGWVLHAVALRPDSPRRDCATLQVDYQRSGAAFLEDYISLQVTSAACPTYDVPLGDPIRVGSYTGSAEADADGVLGQLADGRTAVAFSTTLSVEDTATVLASLAPFDAGMQPAPLAGIPS